MPLSSRQIKTINSLKFKSKRHEEGLFIAEGVKLVKEILNSAYSIHSIYTTDDPFSTSKNVPVHRISEKELSRISQLKNANGILALVHILDQSFDASIAELELVMVLDGIQDPGNLGTLIRIADWFGIHHVLCSYECADVYNSKVIQASMGSITRVKVCYEDLSSFISASSAPVYGAVLDGEHLFNSSLSPSGFLVFGSEARGISEKVTKLLTEKLTIPRVGGAESLNVASAAAIVCSEFRRS